MSLAQRSADCLRLATMGVSGERSRPLAFVVPVDDLGDVTAPNCAACLVTMEATGKVSRERWQCLECGLVQLS